MWDQESRKKTSAKTSSTSKVIERREANTPINLMKVYTMFMINEESP